MAVVIAIVLWSASSLFVRAGHSDALVFTTWRLWFALPPLAVIVAWRSRGSQGVALWPPDVSRGRWLGLMFGAGAFFVSGAATAFAALGLTRLLDVTLIGALQPVLIIAFAVAFLGESVHRSHLTRAGVAIAGTIVVAAAASRNGSWSLAGDVVAVVSLVLNAGWFLYGRVLRTNFEIDPFAFMLSMPYATAITISARTNRSQTLIAASLRGFPNTNANFSAGPRPRPYRVLSGVSRGRDLRLRRPIALDCGAERLYFGPHGTHTGTGVLRISASVCHIRAQTFHLGAYSGNIGAEALHGCRSVTGNALQFTQQDQVAVRQRRDSVA